MRCRCGNVLRDDDPENSFMAFAKIEYNVEIDSAELIGRAKDLWRCPACGRLWVFWDGFNATEYVQQP
jgi:uncharacterized protein with PIN domain